MARPFSTCRLAMNERIPATLVETPDPRTSRLTPARQGGTIHTRSFSGLFRRLRLLGSGALFLLFFGTAWLTWDGRQAVLWDLPERKFYIFGATIWPQDLILLSALLIICAFGLFLITVLAGRVWCGYACPQSMWTWVFMWAEKVTEGDRSQRIKLDAAPWSARKLLRRSAKHGLWLAISLATALAFVGYFTPIRELAANLFTLNLGLGEAFWLLSFTAATYLNAGYLREKVCRDMCPYSRFQSVMFDEHTLIISYDAARGENRGSRRKGVDHRAEGLGDCVDCSLCVQVCPTGIDIREGLQLECIGCAACVDVCDSVMDKMGYPRGLIRYTSEHALAGGKTRFTRPRLVGYAVALLLMFGAFGWALQARSLIHLDVTRDRTLYRVSNDGQIENVYRLKVINKSQQPRTYRLDLEETDRFRLVGRQTLELAAGEILDLPVSVVLLAERPSDTRELHFVIADTADSDNRVSSRSTFMAPRH
jgi:cytochrome c oxidase accessory protein FixG